MAAPNWSDKISIVTAQCLTNGNAVRGVLSLATCFGGFIFIRVGRLSSTAPATGVYVRLRRYLYDIVNVSDIPHPGAMVTLQDTTTAANATTLSATPTFPASAVTLTTATGFAGNQAVVITNLTSASANGTAATRGEWQETSKLATSTLTFDRPLANTTIVSGDTIANQALVPAAIWLDGGAGNSNFEVIFDYGLEANTSPLIVEAWAQTLNSIS